MANLNFWNSVIQLVFFTAFVLLGFSTCMAHCDKGPIRTEEDSPSTKPQENKKLADYSNLELETKYLKGSRWAIENQQNGTIIEVFHSIEVVDIAKVDVQTMSIRIELHLRQRWVAQDLNLPEGLFQEEDSPEVFIRTDPAILRSLWSPDSFIPSARETKIASMTTQQSVVNIFKNKTIVFKARLFTILGCAFSFQWYPLDKQICDLTIESYTLTTNFVRYRWESDQAPVSVAALKLLQYDINLPILYTNGSAERWGRSERYPFVLCRFEFERQLNHNLIQVITPTVLVVAISWMSFWLGLDAVPGRISLLITCMLTLVTMHTGLSGALPPVNYIKMMDIWMVSCMSFVFAALCEFVVVKFMHWRKLQKTKAAEKQEAEMKEYMEKYHPLTKGDKGTEKQLGNPYVDFYKNVAGGGGREDAMMKDFNPEKSVAVQMDMVPPYQRRGAPAWYEGNNKNVPYQPLQPQNMISSSGEWLHPNQRMDGGFRSPVFNNAIGQWGFPPGHPGQKPKIQRPLWVKIDRASRVLFPFLFLVFNCFYWPYLITGAANQ